MVTWSDETKKFTVTAHDRTEDRTYSEEFDYVVVASGHFSTPNVPWFEGFDTFQGRVLHSHDFRDATEFRAGTCWSLAVPIRPRTSAREVLQIRREVDHGQLPRPMAFNFPEGWEQKPLLQKVVGKTAHFKDGSTKEIDAVILCTGYLHSFPFLTDDLKLKTNNRMWPSGIYKGVVWEKNPALFYIGMQDQFYTFNMFDAQAWYARDVMLGPRTAPPARWPPTAMIWRDREETLADAEQMIWFQGDYTKELIEATDYPSFDIEETNKTFMEWEHHKMENIMGFRDNAYRSLMTGTMAPKHHTKWMGGDGRFAGELSADEVRRLTARACSSGPPPPSPFRCSAARPSCRGPAHCREPPSARHRASATRRRYSPRDICVASCRGSARRSRSCAGSRPARPVPAWRRPRQPRRGQPARR